MEHPITKEHIDIGSDIVEDISLIHDLTKGGKIHLRLLLRLGLLSVITLSMFALVLWDIGIKGLSPISGGLFALLGFLAGYFFFSKFRPVMWDEAREVITVGRFDFMSLLALLLYIIARLKAKLLIGYYYHNVFVVSGLFLAFFFGISLGRLSFTLARIRQVHKENL